MAPAHERTLRQNRRLASGGVLALGILTSAALVIFLNSVTPIGDWFALPFALMVFWHLLLNLAWLSGGFAIVNRLLPEWVPFLERLIISVATGVAGFYVTFYVAGALHLFAPATAVVVPLAFIAAGVRPMVRWWREHQRASFSDQSAPRLSGLPLAATIFGALGVALVYLGAFTPGAINYDAAWYHLPIAEAYAREGRIVAFDGNWHREYPHLASILDTYGFLVPGLAHPALRWMMALHGEVALFVWTLVGIAAVANWMVRAPAVRGAWAAMFLFPGIFIYDGNIGGGADHVLAFFAAPLFLLSVRAPTWRSDRPLFLWGALAGAAIMTKYLGIYTVIPLGIVLLAGMVLRRRDVRPFDRRLLRSAAWLAGGFVLVVAPHFTKNIVSHANPVYPMLLGWFPHSHPIVRDAQSIVENITADRNWRAPTGLGPKVRESLGLIWTFAFKPHYSFMGDIPTFGFAFTLALPLLIAIRDRKRLLVGAAASLGALFVWASTYRVDRHLQILLPLLVATSVAIVVRAWRLGWLAKVGVTTLLAVQLAWAGDLYTVGLDRAAAAIPLINSGRDGRAASRFDGYFTSHQEIGRALPRDAVLLLHHWHPHLGINRRIILDFVGSGGLVDYRTFATSADVYDRFRQLGVTHVAHLPGVQASAQLIDVILFDSFVFEAPGPKTRFGQFELFAMPTVRPRARPPLQAVAIGAGGYADGLYQIGALDNTSTLPPSLHHFNEPIRRAGAGGLSPLLAESDVVVTGERIDLDNMTAQVLARDFQKVSNYPGLMVYLRTVAAPGRTPFKPNGQ
jgi:hypothetical protein